MVKFFQSLFAVCCSLFFVSAAMANDAFRFSGFGNLGLTLSDSNQLGYRTDLAQSDGVFKNDTDLKTLSKIGVQFEYTPSHQFGLVTQAVYRKQENTDLDNFIRLAFLKYKPNANIDVKAGRLALDLFMLTEYRDVDFAHPWATVPTETYGILEARYIDGVDVSYRIPFNQSQLTAKVYYGESNYNIFSDGVYSEIKLEELCGITLELADFDYSVGVRYSKGALGNSIDSLDTLIGYYQLFEGLIPGVSEFAQKFALEGSSAEYFSIGGRYDFGTWAVLTEFSHVTGDSKLIRHLDSGYVSVLRYVNNWQFFASYSFTDSKPFRFDSVEEFNIPISALPQELLMLAYQTENITNFFASNQRTYSLGARWDLADDKALTIQLDNTSVEPQGSTLWIRADQVSNSEAQDVNTLFINYSFTF